MPNARNKLPMTAKTRPSHHGPNGRFQNPPGSPKGTVSFGDFARFLYHQSFKIRPPRIPDWHALSPEDSAAQLAAARAPSITWLGHACFLIRIGGKVILTDPFLGARAGKMGFGPKRFLPSPMRVEDLPAIDILLMSHNHYDHLDAGTIARLPGKERMQVIVPLGVGAFFTKRGYRHVTETDWWQTWSVPGLSIEALPAVHFSGRGLFDRKKALWSSYAIRTEDKRIWFSGDTAYGEIFHELGERAGPFDYAMIGIGAYEPSSIMVEVHANPEEAIAIAKAVGAAKTIGMHWGTIMLTPEDPFEAPVRFRKAAIDQGYGEENALILQNGGTLSL